MPRATCTAAKVEAVAGVWGYLQYKEDSGTDLNDASMNTTKTTIAVDDGAKFAIGQTIMIGDEQMLITNIATNDLTGIFVDADVDTDVRLLLETYRRLPA